MSAFAISMMSGASTNAAVGVQTPGVQQQPEVPTTTPQDTATLSPTAQALQLYQQGASVSTIANALGLSVATVDSYLNISVQMPTASSIVLPTKA